MDAATKLKIINSMERAGKIVDLATMNAQRPEYMRQQIAEMEILGREILSDLSRIELHAFDPLPPKEISREGICSRCCCLLSRHKIAAGGGLLCPEGY